MLHCAILHVCCSAQHFLINIVLINDILFNTILLFVILPSIVLTDSFFIIVVPASVTPMNAVLISVVAPCFSPCLGFAA
jgi:hypothetical protein